MKRTLSKRFFTKYPEILNWGVLLASLLVLGGCSKKKPARPQGLGRPLALGPATKLELTPNKKNVLFLAYPVPPKEKAVSAIVLQGVFQGTLTQASLEKDQEQHPRILGKTVSNMDDGFRISSDSRHVAFLQNFQFRKQSGELGLASLQGERKVSILAKQVKYYRFSPDGKKLGYIANGGDMHLFDLETGTNSLLTKNVTTFEFSNNSQYISMRRPLAAGGNLFLAMTSAPEELQSISSGVAEYGFSPDGETLAFTAKGEDLRNSYRLFWGPAKTIKSGKHFVKGGKVTSFRFSPDGQWIAYEDGAEPDRALGVLYTVPVSGGAQKRIGENVFEYRWSPQSQTIALRENNEEKGRKWITLKIASPTGVVEHQESWTPSEKLERIPMTWSPNGKYLAFMRAVYKPVFSPNLYVYQSDQGTQEIAQWAFGFQFAPGKEEIWYQAECLRGGRECNLLSKPLQEIQAPSRKLAAGILSFEPVSNGERIFLMYPRYENEKVADLGWVDLSSGQTSKGIDRFAQPAIYPIDSQGNVVVYIIKEKGREGVYLASLSQAVSSKDKDAAPSKLKAQ